MPHANTAFLAFLSRSTPLDLATQTTGRAGSGTPHASAQQAQILLLLLDHGATENLAPFV